MKAVAHHLGHDLSRFRWLSLAWLTLVGLRLYMALTGSFASSDPVDIAARSMESALYLGALGLMAAAVLLTVPQYRTTAFWPTRPFRRRDLLSSKLAFLGLVLLAPLAVAQAAVLLTMGMDSSQLFLGLIEGLSLETAVVFCVAALATLAGSLPRFLMLLATIVGLQFFLLPLAGRPANRSGLEEIYYWLAQSDSRVLATALLAAVLSAGHVGFQFWTRDRPKSIALAALGLVALLVTYSRWDWPLSRLAAQPISDPAPYFEIDRPLPEDRFHKFPSPTDEGLLSRWTIHHLPPGVVGVLEPLNFDLSFPDQPPLQKVGWGWRFGASQGIRQALAEESESQGGARSFERSFPLCSLTKEEFDRLADLEGSLAAEGDLRLFRLGVRHRIPLREGARASSDGTSAFLSQVRVAAKTVQIEVHEKKADLTLAPRCCASYWLEVPSLHEKGLQHLFRAKRRGGGNNVKYRWTIVKPISTTTRYEFVFSLRHLPSLPDNWLEEARIVRVDGALESDFATSFAYRPFRPRDFSQHRDSR